MKLLFFCLVVAALLALPVSAKTAQAASTKVSKSTLTMAVGRTYKLKATVSGSSKKVTWSSTNKSVATVSSSGKVTAKGTGICYIKVKANGKTAKCKVTVYSSKILKNDFYLTGAYIDYEVGSSEAYDTYEALNDTSSSRAWDIYTTSDKKFLACTTSQIICTRRGIKLGASKSDVILAYGTGTTTTMSSSEGIYHVASLGASEDAWNLATFNTIKTAKTCLSYTYSRNSSYSIHFYFNSSNKLIAVAYVKGYSSLKYVTGVASY